MRMAFCFKEMGHRVFLAELKDLSWTAQKKSPFGRVYELEFPATKDLAQHPFEPKLHEPFVMDLIAMDMIHMRKEPPLDISFLNALWILRKIKEQNPKTKIINDPDALLFYNEKLSIFSFPKFCAPALVSQNADELFDFFKTHCEHDAIIKPLQLFGGRGIKRLTLKESFHDKELKEELLLLTESETIPRLIQPFNKSIFDGEIRVFTVNGKAVSWCKKKPAKGQFLAGTAAGATLEDFIPDHQMEQMVTEVAEELTKKGIYLTGMDIIGGKLSEINITSPRLLSTKSDDLDGYRMVCTQLMSYL